MLSRFQFNRFRPFRRPDTTAEVQDGRMAARVVCIASGKGGTGKSIIASNIAVHRARRGERVLLVDFGAILTLHNKNFRVLPVRRNL